MNYNVLRQAASRRYLVLIPLSKASISKVTEILWKDSERFKKRNLSSFEVEHLFLDAIYESVRKLYGIKEAILVAWASSRM